MYKGELIDYITKPQNCTKIEAEKVTNVFTDTVISVLAEGNDISLLGFGKFCTTKVAAKVGRDTRNGAPLNIKAYTQPTFTVGQALKDSIKAAK